MNTAEHPSGKPWHKEGPLTLALIGAGKAGRSLAARAVKAGHHVLLEDVLPSRLREALEEIPTVGMPGKLETVTTVEDAVRNADLVIDFVPDELESKLEIVCMVDRMAPPRTIMCINTHALSVNDLANCTYRADRCIAAELADEVHLVHGTQTSSATEELTRRFFETCGWGVSSSSEHVPEGQTL
ncbi:MAG: 3-hydroxyacyl-CoA dehydrogenase NAD-binding domain-containing protein [Janthinobacterium lividum]